MSLEVALVPALRDNYVFLARDPAGGDAAVIDPGEAEPVLAEAARRGWRVGQILNTHWHPDHVGGNLAVKAATGATVTGPAREAARIPGLDRAVGEGDTVTIGGAEGSVAEVGAHTAGHIAFLFEGAAFVGDTLFAMGCGRMFEGDAAAMHAALAKLMALPNATRVYCAHEYTQSNARFALTVEPGNAALRARAAEVDRLRAAGLPTVPTTIGAERATNPFARAATPAELGRLRAAKDVYQ